MNSLANIATELELALGGLPAGAAIDYLPAVDSTNSELKRRCADGALAGPAVLVTDDQWAGRGTHGRSWAQLAGRDLALTIAIDGATPGYGDPRLPLAAGAACALALEPCIAETAAPRPWARLRWPNDLCAGDPPRKFGGLLLERSRGWVFIGVGLNVNSTVAELGPGLRDSAMTLAELAGEQLDRLALATGFLAGLLGLLGWNGDGIAGRVDTLLAQWQARDATAGKSYRLAGTGERVEVQGVDIASGELVCRTAGGAPVRIGSYRELADG